MPKPTLRAPRYCRQKEKGRPDRAYVVIAGRRIALGAYGSPESYQKFGEAVASAGTAPKPATPVPAAPTAPTLSALMVAFLEHALRKYGAGHGELDDIKGAFRILRETHGALLARDFGPKAYQQMRAAMITRGWSRGYVNEQCQRIKRFVGWGVCEELLPRDARHALDAVPGLSRGEFGVRETEPVLPVDAAVVEATLAELSDTVADMVRVQLLTGMRPAELCMMRPCDLDRSGDVWSYVPMKHKTQHFGKSRTIFLGPQAQAVLLRYLARASDAFCFSPVDAETKRLADQRAANGKPPVKSNRAGNRKVKDRYDVNAYRRAIQRACDRAFPHPTLSSSKRSALTPAERKELAAWRASKRWAPNQLRHSAATTVRKHFGLEAAQSVLGHSSMNVTQVYAEKHHATAIEVAQKIG